MAGHGGRYAWNPALKPIARSGREGWRARNSWCRDPEHIQSSGGGLDGRERSGGRTGLFGDARAEECGTFGADILAIFAVLHTQFGTDKYDFEILDAGEVVHDLKHGCVVRMWEITWFGETRRGAPPRKPFHPWNIHMRKWHP